MKNLIYLLLSMVLLVACSSTKEMASKKYDTRAIQNLDLLSTTIGELESCSYTLHTIKTQPDGVMHSYEHDTYLRGPNKAHLHSKGGESKKSYWYDGQKFSYLSYDENTFDTVPVPGNILETIHLVNKEYDIDFPAGDLFYPTLTDDIINHYDQVLLIEDDIIDGVDCIGVEASNTDEMVNIWIAKATNLPVKLIIQQHRDSDDFYEAAFSNWKSNPELPDTLFEFHPPAGAKKAKLSNNS